jgi:hypothetical protein
MQTLHRLHPALCGVICILLSSCVMPPHEHDQGAETAPEGLTALSPAAVAESAHGVNFERQIKPILESKCLACHSGPSAPWGYSLESRKLAFAPGASGSRIVPGKPDQSLIVAFASTHKNVAAMPLVGNRLTETESRILRRWIADGANWPVGKAGMLKPGSDALRPERVPLSKDWRFWFNKGEPER